MHGRRLHQHKAQEQPVREDVRAYDLRRDRDGQEVGEEVLGGMRELGGEGDGGDEAVVEFVDGCVEEGMVEEAVGVVEEEFAKEDTGGELPEDGCEGGERGGDEVGGGFAVDVVLGGEEEEVQDGGEELVAQDD